MRLHSMARLERVADTSEMCKVIIITAASSTSWVSLDSLRLQILQPSIEFSWIIQIPSPSLAGSIKFFSHYFRRPCRAASDKSFRKTLSAASADVILRTLAKDYQK